MLSKKMQSISKQPLEMTLCWGEKGQSLSPAGIYPVTSPPAAP